MPQSLVGDAGVSAYADRALSETVIAYWVTFAARADSNGPGLPHWPPYDRNGLLQHQENMACGFWPGNPSASGVTLGQPTFYAYIYPEPPDFKKASVRPGVVHYDERLGEFILLYEDVRRTVEPARTLREFFESAYDAAAMLAHWDRGLLERRLP
jgi:hypothetical protein